MALHILSVLLATLALVVLGSLWYGPLFGKSWMQLIGIARPDVMTPEIKRMMAKSYGIQFLASLVLSFVMAHVIVFVLPTLHLEPTLGAALLGLLAWVGFVAPATLGSVLWEGRSWKYWGITAGYYLVALPFLGVFFTLWS